MTGLQDRCLDCNAARLVFKDITRGQWKEETKEQKWCDHEDIVTEDIEPEPAEHDRDWSAPYEP